MPNVESTADLMSPLTLFLSADIVVKVVMLGLLAASVWTWAIIFTHSLRLRRINRQTEAYERDFWAASDIDGFHAKRGEEKLPTAAVLTAGLDEWRRSTRGGVVDRAGTRERLASRMNAAVASELDHLGERLNILATVGSVAPFVGLFGTVWGILTAFQGLGNVQQATLATVAPSIAEALIATAMGLFAAIPAVIAYNRYADKVSRLELRYDTFMEELSTILQRHAGVGSGENVHG
jgi:biopolymer transport protein TolQ